LKEQQVKEFSIWFHYWYILFETVVPWRWRQQDSSKHS